MEVGDEDVRESSQEREGRRERWRTYLILKKQNYYFKLIELRSTKKTSLAFVFTFRAINTNYRPLCFKKIWLIFFIPEII